MSDAPPPTDDAGALPVGSCEHPEKRVPLIFRLIVLLIVGVVASSCSGTEETEASQTTSPPIEAASTPQRGLGGFPDIAPSADDAPSGTQYEIEGWMGPGGFSDEPPAEETGASYAVWFGSPDETVFVSATVIWLPSSTEALANIESASTDYAEHSAFSIVTIEEVPGFGDRAIRRGLDTINGPGVNYLWAVDNLLLNVFAAGPTDSSEIEDIVRTMTQRARGS